MKSGRLIVPMLSVLAVLAWAATAAAKPSTCAATAVADAKVAVDQACPCTGKPDLQGVAVPWKNHGQYVSCITKATKAAAKSAGVARQCLKDVVPCAAHSTCGKSADADIACSVLTPGTCNIVAGTCENDASTFCTSDADCPVLQSCAVMSADECVVAQGSAATVSCCSE
jgi:hypothetical protein